MDCVIRADSNAIFLWMDHLLLASEVLTTNKTELKKAIETAIRIEDQSYELYTMAKQRATLPSSKKFLGELAEEEQKLMKWLADKRSQLLMQLAKGQ